MNHVRAAIWWKGSVACSAACPAACRWPRCPGARPSDGVEVMLVTSRDTGRWVLPKGWPEFGEQFCEAAAREAGEEAGLKGAISTHEAGRYYYSKGFAGGDSVRCEVLVYALEVDDVADKWKEKGQRKRKWFTPAKAAEMVAEPDLGEVILHSPASRAAPLPEISTIWLDHISTRPAADRRIISSGVQGWVLVWRRRQWSLRMLPAALDAEAYDAVFTTLLEYHPDDIVSTHNALAQRAAPGARLPARRRGADRPHREDGNWYDHDHQLRSSRGRVACPGHDEICLPSNTFVSRVSSARPWRRRRLGKIAPARIGCTATSQYSEELPMIPWRELDSAKMPGGGEALRLKQRGAEFSIMLGSNELMNSRLSGSEASAGEAGVREDPRPPPRAHTDRRARHGFHAARGARRTSDDAAITVAELVPAVVAWARGPMAEVFAGCLDDPRVEHSRDGCRRADTRGGRAATTPSCSMSTMARKG